MSEPAPSSELPPPRGGEAVGDAPADAVAGDGAAVRLRHAARFQFLLGGLVFLAVAALAVATVLVLDGGDGAERGSAWSSFAPSTDGLESGAREIGDYVGRSYRMASGEQIVAVDGGPLRIQGLPLTIVHRESPADGGDITLHRGDGVLYRMCGLGPQCAIDKGEPTTERGLLLRREAIELALYSFRYLRDLDHVVVFLPPPKGEEPSLALHFQRSDLAGQLARPLVQTLPPPVPNPDTIATAPNKAYIQHATDATLFKVSFTTANQDNAVILVLDPPQTTS